MELKKIIKKEIIKRTPNWLKRELVNERISNLNVFFSQEGEDILLCRIFKNKKNGLYIDVGAHHPIRFSNTYLFYLKGWRGINIDPIPGSKKEFDKERPKDINLEIGISNARKTLNYFDFKEKAFNTFSRERANIISTEGRSELIQSTLIQTYPLGEVLETYLPTKVFIDFMTIDVEGLELEVIKSNDWKKFRPQYLLVEKLDFVLEELFQDELVMELRKLGYTPFAKTFNTLFFKDNVQSE